jgi:hypothetical protein
VANPIVNYYVNARKRVAMAVLRVSRRDPYSFVEPDNSDKIEDAEREYTTLSTLFASFGNTIV